MNALCLDITDAPIATCMTSILAFFDFSLPRDPVSILLRSSSLATRFDSAVLWNGVLFLTSLTSLTSLLPSFDLT